MILGARGGGWPVVKDIDPPPPLWRGEATCQVLSSLLGFPAQERHGCTGEGPVEGYKDGEGTEERLRELDLFSLKKMFTSLSKHTQFTSTLRTPKGVRG